MQAQTSTVVAISAAASHALALTTSGFVFSWGNNLNSQLGRTATTIAERATPTWIPTLSEVIGIAAGNYHGLAITNSAGTHEVWAWGANTSGALGNGTLGGISTTPVRVLTSPGVPLTGVIRVAANEAFSLALTGSGHVYAWGNNADGQLGNGSTNPQLFAAQVTGLPGNIVSIAAGAIFSAALTATGDVYFWGREPGTASNQHLTPVLVNFGAGFPIQALAAGDYHLQALTASGEVMALGFNTHGQLGDGIASGAATFAPALVTGVQNALHVGAGGLYGFAAITGPALGFTPRHLNFIGNGATQDLVVTNTGTALLFINGLDIDNADFAYVPLSGDCAVNFALNPGQTCFVRLQYLPQPGTTTSAGTLQFDTNAVFTPPVRLTGTN